ncbi:MAG TPA: hypothetical protein VJS64_17945 [Pyrinomonadaceae bacterium]|nr:hypothetical protein [Pyrinomonadaceae bacterium]
MQKVDMSAKAVTTRLKRLSQLRKLSLSLQKAKIIDEQRTNEEKSAKQSSLTDALKNK